MESEINWHKTREDNSVPVAHQGKRRLIAIWRMETRTYRYAVGEYWNGCWYECARTPHVKRINDPVPYYAQFQGVGD